MALNAIGIGQKHNKDMKLFKIFKITFSYSPSKEELSIEEKVIRGLGFVVVKAANEEEARKKIKWKPPIQSVECIGVLAE